MAGSTKRTTPSKTETNFPYLMYVDVGDRYNDGHGRHDQYLFRTNVEPKKVLAAYLKACKSSGVYLHEDRKASKKSVIGVNYEDNEILPEVKEKLEKLEKFGVNIDYHEGWDESVAGGWDYLFSHNINDNLSIFEKGCAFLLLEMARVQLLKDDVTLVFKEEVVPVINDHYQIGYGCYHG